MGLQNSRFLLYFYIYASVQNTHNGNRKNYPVYIEKKIDFIVYVHIDLLIHNDLKNVYTDYGSWDNKHSLCRNHVAQSAILHKIIKFIFFTKQRHFQFHYRLLPRKNIIIFLYVYLPCWYLFDLSYPQILCKMTILQIP